MVYNYSFKTKGNLTKHMKSKAHFKKCCELGINLVEDMESVELSQGTGETDDDSDSDDEGNEGETESSGNYIVNIYELFIQFSENFFVYSMFT